MKFDEKIRELRREKKLSQGELAKAIGVCTRTIASYECGTSFPRYKQTYEALAKALGVDVNFLRTEDEQFFEEVGQEFGNAGQRQAQALLTQAGELFAGGELSDDDKMAFITEMQQLFLDAKRRAKAKYTPKKYRPGKSAE